MDGTLGEKNAEEMRFLSTSGDCDFGFKGKNRRPSASSGSVSGSTEGSTDNRGEWANKVQFFLAIMGYTIGIGSVWRFPIICRYLA